MDTWVQILEVVIWPVTIIVVVALMRAPLSKLVPTLKRLKYKDLELEFEREASKILAEIERDLPEPERSPDVVAEPGPEIRFKLVSPEPTDLVLRTWGELEAVIRNLVGHNSYEKISVGSLVKKLADSGKANEETIRVILDLAALRNRVAHAKSEVISNEMASAYANSVRRVIAVLGGIYA